MSKVVQLELSQSRLLSLAVARDWICPEPASRPLTDLEAENPPCVRFLARLHRDDCRSADNVAINNQEENTSSRRRRTSIGKMPRQARRKSLFSGKGEAGHAGA